MLFSAQAGYQIVMIDLNVLKDCFHRHFPGSEPLLFSAPGRINIIGEHTDYNGGFVLPASIDKAISAAIAPNESGTVNIWSVDKNEKVSFAVGGSKPSALWACYPYGVVEEMRKRGAAVGGFDAVFGGDVPLGAGMSSSAALESCFGVALNTVFNLGFTREDLAKIGQMTEHNYVGVKCGIMDQFASIFGEEGKVVRLDCRSLEYSLVPFNPEGLRLVLIDTMVKHSLASSQYNVRREQCEAGVSVVARHKPGVELLRDVTMDDLDACREEMDPVVYRRCSFVIRENARLMAACAAMERGDYQELGRQIYAAHEGLSKDYEVSCKELDFLVDVAKSHSGVLGARMMGGGFGGCVIALVKEECFEEFIADARRRYSAEYSKNPRIIEVSISNGARQC